MFKLLFALSILVYADSTALLKSFISNHFIKFFANNTFFICYPYGIKTLSEIYSSKKLSKKCKKEIDIFRQYHPKEKYYYHYVLNIEQKYHINFVDNQCILYINSGDTYNEILLRKGYAYINKNIKPKYLRKRFIKAQNIAKYNKNGMFYKEEMIDCVKNE